MPGRLVLQRILGRPLVAALLVVVALHVAAASAQTTQNPSPMSDTTRPHPRAAESRPEGQRSPLSLGELFIPARAANRRRAAMPLVVHFHGASWLIEQHVARGAPHAALVTVNLGAGSGRYATPFARITGGALDNAEAKPGPLLLQGDHGPVEYRTS